MNAILEAARAAYAAGLAPIPTENTGSKKPDVRRWKHYQTTRPGVDDLRAFNFAAHDGLGILAGAVSGHRECWDWDTDEVFVAFIERAHRTGLGALVDRVFVRGYLDRTPGGGRRSIVTYPATLTFKDCTLARRPGRAGEPPIKTLIELPTYNVIAPSNGRTHPSGRPYERLSGGFDQIASYSEAERQTLLTLAATFDEIPRVEARSSSVPHPDVGARPGDDYNRRTTWPALLEPRGWTIAFERDGVTYWRRPGKTIGVSATTNYAGSDLFYPFTSSTVFEPDKSYSKFAVLTTLDFDGDFSRAAFALFKDGYGTDVHDDRDPPEPSTTREPSAGTTPTPTRSIRLIAADTITLRPVRWLWADRLPLGTFALVGGREGVGKSILVYTLAANITNGTLAGIYGGTPKSVIVAATEDSWEHTIAPRLMAAGADLSKVYRADVIDPDGFDVPLSLPKDTTALAQAIADVDAALVVLDPLLSRLDSRLDSHKDADVRRALEPLAAMADTSNVVVLGLIHVNKSTSTDALTLLMASRAFVAVARSVLFVAVNPDDEHQRLLANVKSNLGRLDLPTLVFQIRGVLVQTTASGDEIWTGQLTWLGGSDQSLRDVLERIGEREQDAHARHEAERWLLDYLASLGGTAAKKDVMVAGKQAGHSERTLHRARQHAGIQTDFRGFPCQSFWLSPSSSRAASGDSDGTTSDGGTQGTTDAQLCHEPPVVPVVPRSGDVPTGGATGPTPVVPVVPPRGTSLLAGTTGTTGVGGTTGAPAFADADPIAAGGLRLSALGNPISTDAPDDEDA